MEARLGRNFWSTIQAARINGGQVGVDIHQLVRHAIDAVPDGNDAEAAVRAVQKVLYDAEAWIGSVRRAMNADGRFE